MNPEGISLPADIVERAAADFAHELPATAWSLLDEYQGAEGVRVIRCAIHLAEGRTERLRHFMASAQVDHRDVILWAEYDLHDQRVRDFNLPFGSVPLDLGDASLSHVCCHSGQLKSRHRHPW